MVVAVILVAWHAMSVYRNGQAYEDRLNTPLGDCEMDNLSAYNKQLGHV